MPCRCARVQFLALPRQLTACPRNPPPLEVAIIGGGPAGLIAAEVLATRGRLRHRLRPDAVGRPQAAHGGPGRAEPDPLGGVRAHFLARYAEAAPQLRPLIEAFRPEDLRAWCEGLGQETFVGSSGRVFPKAFKASPLLRAWLRAAGSARRPLRPAPSLAGLGRGRRPASSPMRPASRSRVEPDATILALGGASWPRLGSDGDLGRTCWPGAASPSRPCARPIWASSVAWSEVMRSRFEGEPLKRIALTFEGSDRAGRGRRHGGRASRAARSMPSRRRCATPSSGTASALLHVDLRPDLPYDALAKRLERPAKGPIRLDLPAQGRRPAARSASPCCGRRPLPCRPSPRRSPASSRPCP